MELAEISTNNLLLNWKNLEGLKCLTGNWMVFKKNWLVAAGSAYSELLSSPSSSLLKTFSFHHQSSYQLALWPLVFSLLKQYL